MEVHGRLQKLAQVEVGPENSDQVFGEVNPSGF